MSIISADAITFASVTDDCVMKKESVIWLPKVTPSYYETEAVSVFLCQFFSEAGGVTWAGWEGDVVKIRIHNVPRKSYTRIINTVIKDALKSSATLTMVETQENFHLMPIQDVPWGTILFAPRLTRSLLYALPSGVFVISRRFSNGVSVFAERLYNNRLSAWKRAKSVRANGIHCHLAWSNRHFEEMRRNRVPLLSIQ